MMAFARQRSASRTEKRSTGDGPIPSYGIAPVWHTAPLRRRSASAAFISSPVENRAVSCCVYIESPPVGIFPDLEEKYVWISVSETFLF